MKSREKILTDIDRTIDQLVQNEEVLKRIVRNPNYKAEILALKKTQESLLAHLIHMDHYLHHQQMEESKNIQEKLTRLNKLSEKKKIYRNTAPRVRKRKKKSVVC
jgi:hypothetical protein